MLEAHTLHAFFETNNSVTFPWKKMLLSLDFFYNCSNDHNNNFASAPHHMRVCPEFNATEIFLPKKSLNFGIAWWCL